MHKTQKQIQKLTFASLTKLFKRRKRSTADGTFFHTWDFFFDKLMTTILLEKGKLEGSCEGVMDIFQKVKMCLNLHFGLFFFHYIHTGKKNLKHLVAISRQMPM